ncbi:EmrB/QacA subfamily drug resistance transporter [Paenibacillus phyllosphaerae]|uniref:EmrB/QacA subfamily drug resistance transporter n=1 Tax=Paenibacillus phyllosphaerae TaxID=274593 RepID=A0A7W5B1P5_9BACL|nr:DHA2 family efflux MFS transporter permease subunit [Paenibacillus phyllosphaerae]MBB3112494.1 EmrB/QacA subfamily drug resistance transporter [Paenibacillus phyllosphaerae]
MTVHPSDAREAASDGHTTNRSPASFWPVLVTIFLGSFAGMYHVVSLNVSLPGFIGIFDTELRVVQWMLTGFTLASGIIVPVTGYAMKRFGSKRLFLLAIGGITVSSLLCAISWNVESLIAFRVVQGAFCGLIQPVSLALIYRVIPEDKQPLAVSVWSFSTVLGTAIGPTLSGWLQSFDWPLIFLVTVPVGIGAWVAAAIVLPQDQANRGAKLDLVGLVLATGGSLSLLLLFGNMTSWGWKSGLTWSMLIIGAGGMAAFVWQAGRSRHPLLELKLLRNPRFALSLAASMILSFGLYAVVYFMPLFLVELKGMTPFRVGLLFLPAAACLTGATFFSGRAYAKLGPVKLIIAGSVILFVSTYYFSHLAAGTSLGVIMVWLAIRNIGTGLAMTPATNASMSAVPQELLGHASALLNWLRQVFSALSLGICTSMFYARLSAHQQAMADEGSVPASERYQLAYMMSIHDVFFVASVVVAAVIPIALLIRNPVKAEAVPVHLPKGGESA